MADQAFDFVVVGAGMAGASVAWELSTLAKVLLLEREEHPGYHATGRSAAAFIPSYGIGNPALRTLTEASYPFLSAPPSGFCSTALLARRGLLTIALGDDHRPLLAERELLAPRLPQVELLRGSAARARIAPLRADVVHHALFEPDVFDMDVDALHQGYLRGLRQQGGRLVCNAQLSGIRRQGGRYRLDTRIGPVQAPVLVNASGAWADQLAVQAGAQPVGLKPLRRTAVLLDPPDGCVVDLWPLLLAQDESFYAKPDAGALLVSPADEHPSEPMDAHPDELDIAYAIHNLQQALDLEQPRVRHTWAGLRSFVADRTPVIGMDHSEKGFYWLCGQGGHGIQTAPAVAKLAASQLLEHALPDCLQDVGFESDWVSPGRLPKS